MNEQQLAPMGVGFAVAVVLFLVIGYFLRKRNMTAHLAPVKRELKKEKQWLRRGEYNAAMVKGRQNLELFLKLVAEFNGIELDNSAQAMANAKSGTDGRGQRETYRMNGRKRQRVMTFQQFGWWLDENGYLDRVGKWELNEIRVIGNKAVHENYVSKEDAWNQYNYMEDVLRIVADRHANRRKQRGPAVKKSQAGRHGASVKKTSGAQVKGRGQQNRGQGQAQGRSQGRTGQNQSKNGSQKNSGKQSGGKNGQTARPGGNARQDAKVSGKADQQKKVDGNQKAVQKTEGKKAAEQKSAVNKLTPKKPQNGSGAKTAGKNQTSERTQQKREVKTAVNKAQQSKEVKPTAKVVEKIAVKPPVIVATEKTAENAQPEKMSSSAKRRLRRKRAKAAREAAEAAGMVRETAPREKAAKQTESRQTGVKEKTAKQPENRPARQENRADRQLRQVQPQTSMRIVTLSQSTGGWTAGTDKKETAKSEPSKKNAAPQPKPQSENSAKQPARRRRRPRRRPAAEQAGNTAERTVEKAAAGGGDHEE